MSFRDNRARFSGGNIRNTINRYVHVGRSQIFLENACTFGNAHLILRNVEWRWICHFTKSGTYASVLVPVQSQVTKCRRSPGGRMCSLKILINSIVTTGVNGTESIEVSSVVDDAGVVRVLVQPINIQVRVA